MFNKLFIFISLFTFSLFSMEQSSGYVGEQENLVDIIKTRDDEYALAQLDNFAQISNLPLFLLNLSLKRDSTVVFRRLLEGWRWTTNDKNSAFLEAVLKNNLEAIEILLEHGIDVEGGQHYGIVNIVLSNLVSPLLTTEVKATIINTLEFLLDSGAEPNIVSGINRMNPLDSLDSIRNIISESRYEEFRDVLVRYGARNSTLEEREEQIRIGMPLEHVMFEGTELSFSIPSHIEQEINHGERPEINFVSIGDVGAQAVASSEHLSNLTPLNLGWNRVSHAAVHAIAGSAHMSNLTPLNIGSDIISNVSLNLETASRSFEYTNNQENLEAPEQIPEDTEIDCTICFDMKNGAEMHVLYCNHAFCKGCLIDCLYVANYDQTNASFLLCPHRDCDEKITERDVRRFSDEDQEAIDIFNKIELAQFLSMYPNRFKQCPTPDCKNIYEVDPHARPRTYECHSCEVRYCSHCQEGHSNGIGCEEYQDNLNITNDEDAQNDELRKWREANTQPCPDCGAYIEKNKGCQYIKCTSCQEFFCYICMESFGKSLGRHSMPFGHPIH